MGSTALAAAVPYQVGWPEFPTGDNEVLKVKMLSCWEHIFQTQTDEYSDADIPILTSLRWYNNQFASGIWKTAYPHAKIRITLEPCNKSVNAGHKMGHADTDLFCLMQSKEKNDVSPTVILKCTSPYPHPHPHTQALRNKKTYPHPQRRYHSHLLHRRRPQQGPFEASSLAPQWTPGGAHNAVHQLLHCITAMEFQFAASTWWKELFLYTL